MVKAVRDGGLEVMVCADMLCGASSIVCAASIVLQVALPGGGAGFERIHRISAQYVDMRGGAGPVCKGIMRTNEYPVAV